MQQNQIETAHKYIESILKSNAFFRKNYGWNGTTKMNWVKTNKCKYPWKYKQIWWTAYTWNAVTDIITFHWAQCRVMADEVDPWTWCNAWREPSSWTYLFGFKLNHNNLTLIGVAMKVYAYIFFLFWLLLLLLQRSLNVASFAILKYMHNLCIQSMVWRTYIFGPFSLTSGKQFI